ncbi:hypothetical protein AABD38_07955 [Staphylococcus nepalensis]
MVLVTNQQALAKVHETISSYSETNKAIQSKTKDNNAHSDAKGEKKKKSHIMQKIMYQLHHQRHII